MLAGRLTVTESQVRTVHEGRLGSVLTAPNRISRSTQDKGSIRIPILKCVHGTTDVYIFCKKKAIVLVNNLDGHP